MASQKQCRHARTDRHHGPDEPADSPAHHRTQPRHHCRKEQQLARLQTGYTNTREQAALEEEIRLLKERNGLLSDQGVKEQYVAAQQEITDTWVSIDRTAHDVCQYL